MQVLFISISFLQSGKQTELRNYTLTAQCCFLHAAAEVEFFSAHIFLAQVKSECNCNIVKNEKLKSRLQSFSISLKCTLIVKFQIFLFFLHL